MSENIQPFEGSLPVASVGQQIVQLQTLMKKHMKKDVHYGTIPGCGDKPVLLKAGAEKLTFMFRLSPSYTENITEMPGGHREYSILCTLTHIRTHEVWGQGVGSASTTENKFCYRWENTGRDVPEGYWRNRDKELLGGPQYTHRKTKSGYKVFERIEHDNPSDYFNTVYKMAKKRAMVDAVLSATAASDIFTQDIEDMVDAEFTEEPPNPYEHQEPPTKEQPPTPKPSQMDEPPDDYPHTSAPPKPPPTTDLEKEIDEFETEVILHFGNNQERAKQWLRENTGGGYNKDTGKPYRPKEDFRDILTPAHLGRLKRVFRDQMSGKG